MVKKTIGFKVNGNKVSVKVEPGEILVDVLREKLGLTRTKTGCREGECGVYSVIINKKFVASCIVPAMKADGGNVFTIEGLEKNWEPPGYKKRLLRKVPAV